MSIHVASGQEQEQMIFDVPRWQIYRAKREKKKKKKLARKTQGLEEIALPFLIDSVRSTSTGQKLQRMDGKIDARRKRCCARGAIRLTSLLLAITRGRHHRDKRFGAGL